MLRTTNLLRAGCLVLMSVAGQNIVLAGGHHGGGNGGGGNHGGMGQSHGGQQFMHHNGSNQLPPRQNAGHGSSPVTKISHNGSNMGSHGMTGIKSSDLRPGSGNGSGMQHASGHSQHQPFNKMHGSNWNHNGGWNYGNKYSSGSCFPGQSYCFPSGCRSGYGCYGSGYGSYGNCYSNWGYGSVYGNYGYTNCGYYPGCYGGYTAIVVQPYPVTTCQTTYVTTEAPVLTTQVTSVTPVVTTAAVNYSSDMLPPSPAPFGLR
jgi:hypothetical protein